MTQENKRVLSGMRPTGKLHLGHYHGVLKNWVKLQEDYDCYFFVADWHALTTHYEDPRILKESVWQLVVDWLAVGIDPAKSVLFIQSQMPEHAELHVLLSMNTPLSWLERVPTYKDQQEKLKDKDLATYGFLGYPLLQSADILLYRAGFVPVGADQVAHVEITREVARRFNSLYGREPDLEQRVEEILKALGKKGGKEYRALRAAYQEQGDGEALLKVQALIAGAGSVKDEDKARLLSYFEGKGKEILPEPQALLTEASKMPGLDGQKMSKSYHNTIALREDMDELNKKIRHMPTDPARVRRNDPGTPEKCPVWGFHEQYSNAADKAWVQQGCTTAEIGCLDCKQKIIDAVAEELRPIQARIQELETDPQRVLAIVNEGRERAREIAGETLQTVRAAMHLNYV